MSRLSRTERAVAGAVLGFLAAVLAAAFSLALSDASSLGEVFAALTRSALVGALGVLAFVPAGIFLALGRSRLALRPALLAFGALLLSLVLTMGLPGGWGTLGLLSLAVSPALALLLDERLPRTSALVAA